MKGLYNTGNLFQSGNSFPDSRTYVPFHSSTTDFKSVSKHLLTSIIYVTLFLTWKIISYCYLSFINSQDEKGNMICTVAEIMRSAIHSITMIQLRFKNITAIMYPCKELPHHVIYVCYKSILFLLIIDIITPIYIIRKPPTHSQWRILQMHQSIHMVVSILYINSHHVYSIYYITYFEYIIYITKQDRHI